MDQQGITESIQTIISNKSMCITASLKGAGYLANSFGRRSQPPPRTSTDTKCKWKWFSRLSMSKLTIGKEVDQVRVRTETPQDWTREPG